MKRWQIQLLLKDINPKTKAIPNTIDGVKGDKNISELITNTCNDFYNSVPYDVNAMNRIKECVQQTT